MKLLLDHNIPLPKRVRTWFPGHEVHTAEEQGWEELSNGSLLRAAAALHGYQLLLTVDKRMEYEHNLERLPLPVVLLDTVPNTFEGLTPLVPMLQRLFDESLSTKFYVVTVDGVLPLTSPRRKG